MQRGQELGIQTKLRIAAAVLSISGKRWEQRVRILSKSTFNCLTYSLSRATAAGVRPNIRRDLKLFKRVRCEPVNKQSSPLFCPFAWESASFMLSGTCGTEESFFCAGAGPGFEWPPEIQRLGSRWSSGLCSLVFPGVSDLQA